MSERCIHVLFRSLSTCIGILFISSVATAAAATEKLPVHYWNFKLGYAFNSDNTLLDDAIFNVKWSSIEPTRGTYDWSSIEEKISDWYNASGKPVWLNIAPYSPLPLSVFGGIGSDNDLTPQWVYDNGVPRITYFDMAADADVSVPEVWDPDFYTLYEEFITAVTARYNTDVRIAGLQPGYGIFGSMTAIADKKNGKDAFLAAGWTLSIWEGYIQDIIDIYKKHSAKPLMMFTAQSFLGTLEEYWLSNQMPTAESVLGYAAEQGVSILFQVLSAVAGEFEDSKAPELVAHLATLSPPPGFSIGFGDDWPLYLQDPGDPGSATEGRDINGFEKELQDAIATWDSIGRKYPLFFAFREPEANATNENGPDFEQAVYDVAASYLYFDAGSTTLLEDGFETDFSKWTDGGATDWNRTTYQKHTGSYSAHAGSADNDLISDNLDITGYSSITIEFWYWDDDIDDADNVFLQLYNGSAYTNKFELNLTTEGTWTLHSVTINNTGGDTQYFRSNFRIKFEGTSIVTGENLLIDDVKITAQ